MLGHLHTMKRQLDKSGYTVVEVSLYLDSLDWNMVAVVYNVFFFFLTMCRTVAWNMVAEFMIFFFLNCCLEHGGRVYDFFFPDSM